MGKEMKRENYTIGDWYWFQDLNNNFFIDRLKGFDDGFVNELTFISEHQHLTENYCPCCAEKEPYYTVDRFEDVIKYDGPINHFIATKYKVNL